MRKYVYKQMEELAVELSAGLLRLRKGYVDAAETLIQILDSDRDYPWEFIVYRLTGYRARSGGHAEPLAGKALRADMLQLMLDVCDSFDLHTALFAEKVYDTLSLARHFHVSTKTIQRWRRDGLPARRLVFPDGKRRIAFMERSILWFVRNREGRIRRSMKFSQMSAPERVDILRRARRMAAFTQCSLSEVSRRLATRTGRAIETIRYTIRNHDLEHPDEAIFPHLSAPLGEREKEAIYHGFLRGTPAPALAEQYQRTRGSIYRVINEMRARQLLSRPISFMYNPQFELPNADDVILEKSSPRRAGLARKGAATPADLPPYLRALYDVPLLDVSGERNLFRLYNYLKYKADKLRKGIDVNHVRTSELKAVEKLLIQANAVKNRIIRANLRLVVSIAKKHIGGPQGLFELVSDGNLSLMRAVEKFDYARGNRFSTYASWAIMRNFARSVPRERYQLDRFSTGHEEILDIAAGLRTYDPNEVNLPELRESIDVVLAQLSPIERSILTNHYGLDSDGVTKTLEQLGRRLGISKERVRQIEIQAIRKLRRIMHPEEVGLSA